MLRYHTRLPLAVTHFVLFAVVALDARRVASAHEGPPFPILMDRRLAGYLVSVWADPDIGEAQFYIIVDDLEGGIPREAPRVSMWVEPVSGRKDRVTYGATRQPVRNQMQFAAQPYFDRQDMWQVGFHLATSGGVCQELTAEIESTPPGFGRWDLAIYLFPFVLLGVMWAIAASRRRHTRQTSFSEDEASAAEEGGRDQTPAARRVEQSQ